MMKKIILLVIITTILISCAKPSGVENALSIESHIQTSGYAVDFSLTEDYIFIAEDQCGFSIYNRENHEQIARVDSIFGGPFENVRKISVSQEHQKLFVYDQYGSPGGFSTYEISNIDSIQFGFNTTGNTRNIQDMNAYSDNGYAYNYWTTNQQITYGYYDENSPYLWISVDDLSLPNTALGFDRLDSLIVIAAGQLGIYMLDVEIPDNQPNDVELEYLVTFNLPGEATDVNIVDSLVFVTLRQEGFAIVDISDRYNPQLIHIQEVNDLVYTIDIEDSYLVVSSHSGGVLLYDITTVTSPQLIGQIDEIGYTYKVEIEDGKIYAATRNGIYKIKIN